MDTSMKLKEYQKSDIRRKVQNSLKDKDIKRGSGRSYYNQALRVVVALKLTDGYDFARGVVNEWLEGK
jgi:hypothetical protein